MLGKECKDHLGNVYRSQQDMCDFYGISSRLYSGRRRQGWSVEDCLLKPLRDNSCVDYLGNKYLSFNQMCEAYGIGCSTVKRRLKAGWTLEDALTKPVNNEVADHLGNVYKSEKDMCNAYNVDYKIFWARTHDMGWSIERALTTSIRDDSCYDYLGKKYSNVLEMCQAYGIKKGTYVHRIILGWSVKDALTIPSGNRNPSSDFWKTKGSGASKECVDYKGNVYPSIISMCRSYDIPFNVFNKRIRSGWSLKDILTTPVVHSIAVEDHLGNKYESIAAMLKHYGVSRSHYSRRIKLGYPLSDALNPKHELPRINSSDYATYVKDTECKDMHGNIFSSVSAMCRHYGVSLNHYYIRIRQNYSLRDALNPEHVLSKKHSQSEYTLQFYKDGKYQDHQGNKFNSFREMCNYHNACYATVYKRLKNGMTLSDALLTTVSSVVKDGKGNEFASVAEMCRYYGICPTTYIKRINSGMSIAEALCTPVSRTYVYKNKEYHSLMELEKATGVNHSVIQQRLYKGMTVEQAIETPVKSVGYNGAYSVSVNGILYNSIADAARAYDKNPGTIISAMHTKHISAEEAILHTYALKNKKDWVDHLGNSFNSLKEMCEYHGQSYKLVDSRIYGKGWSVKEALTVPKRMYIGEYRVAECLKRFNVKFYHDCAIKVIFKDLGLSIDWDDFLSEFQNRLGFAGYDWSKQRIQRLRPDFVLYTDEYNQIRGVVEFDGEQHQNFVEFFFRTIEEFYKRNNIDFVKQSLWEYLKIPMLRIRYDQVDMIDDMVKDFIDNPKKYIHNHNTYLSEEEYWSILTEQKAQIEMAFA